MARCIPCGHVDNDHVCMWLYGVIQRDGFNDPGVWANTGAAVASEHDTLYAAFLCGSSPSSSDALPSSSSLTPPHTASAANQQQQVAGTAGDSAGGPGVVVGQFWGVAPAALPQHPTPVATALGAPSSQRQRPTKADQPLAGAAAGSPSSKSTWVMRSTPSKAAEPGERQVGQAKTRGAATGDAVPGAGGSNKRAGARATGAHAPPAPATGSRTSGAGAGADMSDGGLEDDGDPLAALLGLMPGDDAPLAALADLPGGQPGSTGARVAAVQAVQSKKAAVRRKPKGAAVAGGSGSGVVGSGEMEGGARGTGKSKGAAGDGAARSSAPGSARGDKGSGNSTEIPAEGAGGAPAVGSAPTARRRGRPRSTNPMQGAVSAGSQGGDA